MVEAGATYGGSWSHLRWKLEPPTVEAEAARTVEAEAAWKLRSPTVGAKCAYGGS
jgi:hypothetical protein